MTTTHRRITRVAVYAVLALGVAALVRLYAFGAPEGPAYRETTNYAYPWELEPDKDAEIDQ